MDRQIVSVVIDNGSKNCKAGFSGDKSPRVVFPSVIDHIQNSTSSTETYIGNDVALSKRPILELEYPIKRGIITNWDDIEKVWHYIFDNKLAVKPKDHSVMLTEVSLNSKVNREKMTESMFETFNTPAMFVVNSAQAALTCSGQQTGIVLDSGYGVTHVVPFYEGHPVPHADLRLNFGGSDLTKYLERLLTEKGYNFDTNYSGKIVRDVKEKLCYVIALDYDEEITKGTFQKQYQMPDGRSITIGKERFQCTEALFQPELIGIDQMNLPEMVLKSIRKCNKFIQRDLYANIILSGGGTMFSGFVDRFQREIIKRAPSSMNIKVIVQSERKFSSWIGAAALCSTLPQHKWITKPEYYEYGPSIVHQKCNPIVRCSEDNWTDKNR